MDEQLRNSSEQFRNSSEMVQNSLETVQKHANVLSHCTIHAECDWPTPPTSTAVEHSSICVPLGHILRQACMHTSKHNALKFVQWDQGRGVTNRSGLEAPVQVSASQGACQHTCFQPFRRLHGCSMQLCAQPVNVLSMSYCHLARCWCCWGWFCWCCLCLC